MWSYYQDGVLLTGWKLLGTTWYYFDTTGILQTNGWREIAGKWYYFYTNGTMAVSTKIDGYEIGEDGAMKN